MKANRIMPKLTLDKYKPALLFSTGINTVSLQLGKVNDTDTSDKSSQK